MSLPIVKINYETDHDKLIPFVENEVKIPRIVWERIYLREKEDVESYGFTIPETEYWGRGWRVKTGAPRMRKFKHQNVIYQVTYNI